MGLHHDNENDGRGEAKMTVMDIGGTYFESQNT